MKTLRIKDEDRFLVTWGLRLNFDQCEEFAANDFTWALSVREREHYRRAMRDHLDEMRRCYELRQRLLSPPRPRQSRRAS